MGCGSHIAEVEEGQRVADDAAEAVPEAQAEADHHPDDTDDAQGHEALEHGGDDVFPVHHAAIEEGEARGHEEHEGAGDDHPGYVAGIGLRHVLPIGTVFGEGAAEQGEQGEQGEYEEVELLAHGAESWCQQVGIKNKRRSAFGGPLIH